MTRGKLAVLMVVVVAFALLVTGCLKKAEPIQLQDPDAVTSIDITKIDGTDITVEKQDEIDRIMKTLAGAEPTRTQSVNDTPDDPYGTLMINTDTDTNELHYYERDGEFFVEKSYTGIYRIDHDLEQDIPDTPVPTVGLEFDENGNPTPDSAEQIYQEQMEKDLQEYLKKEQEDAVRDYYISQPDPDPDSMLPGGH